MAEICGVCLTKLTNFSIHDKATGEKNYLRHMVCASCFNNIIRRLEVSEILPCPLCGVLTPHGGWSWQMHEQEN